MSVLRNLESKLAGLVEGTFSRAFKSEVRPVEIARKLAREMEQHKVASLSRTYAPNEYVVWLSPQDREQFEGYEAELRREPDPRRRGARVRVGGRTSVVGSGGAVLGRSREADIQVDDANVSRRHAELRPSGASWTVRDLGSTNGVKVNGRRIQGAQSLKTGDTITLGTSDIVFELE